MVPRNPWTIEAILRLLARLVICIFMGTLASSMVRGSTGMSEVALIALVVLGLGLFAGALMILSRPWSLERFPRNAIVLLICFYGGMVLTWMSMRWTIPDGKAGHSSLDVVIAVLGFQGAGLVLVHYFLREQRIGWADAFGLRNGISRAFFWGIVAAVLFLPLGWALQSFSAVALEHFHLPAPEQEAVEVLRENASLLSRFLLGASAVLLAPVAEEILFRGILYPAIKGWGYPRAAWWGTSLFFAAIHFNMATFLPLTVLALVLIWLYESSGNLLAPIAAHIVFNALNFVVLFLQPAAKP